jgi:hypothetical protein
MHRPTVDGYSELNEKIVSLLQNEQWQEIADHLNNPDTRDLMMFALHSLHEVDKIKKAFSYSRILYSLDADTLVFFALKDEVLARQVVTQSFWQRLGLKIRRFFAGEKTLAIPASRLKSEHLRQLLQKYPSFWQGALQKCSELFCRLTGHRNLRKILKVDDLWKLSADPSQEVRQATSKAVFGDIHLSKQVLAAVNTIEAANARVNLIRDFRSGLTYEDLSTAQGRRFFLRGLDIPQGDENFCVADDQTVEELYYQQFLQLIETSDGHKVPDGHIALRDKIARLWNNAMKLPNREGREESIVKRAMIRVLRRSPENTILKKMPEKFYEEIFSDDVILRNFLENKFLLEAFSRRDFLGFSNNKIRQRILNQVIKHYRATQFGYDGQVKFTLEHVFAVYGLYHVPEGEWLRHPDVCCGAMNGILHHRDNLKVMALFFNCDTYKKKANIVQLMRNAEPMQLVELLLRNTEIQADTKKSVEKIDSQIFDLEKKRGVLAAQKAKSKKKGGIQDQIDQKEKKIQEFQKASALTKKMAEFYSLAVQAIKNDEDLRNKMAGCEISAFTRNPKDHELLLASTHPDLRQQLWDCPERQRFLAEHASLPYILLFLRSSRCPLGTSKNWAPALLKLLEFSQAHLLGREWLYLLENVPDFAAWVVFQYASGKVFCLDKYQLLSLFDFTVSGYDTLKLLEREYHSKLDKHFLIRNLLLSEKEILPRVLQCQRSTVNHVELANLMVRIVELEKDSSIGSYLVSDNNLEFMVTHADAAHLERLLETERPLDELCLPLNIQEKRSLAALGKAYLASFHALDILDRYSKHRWLVVLLRYCPEAELSTLGQTVMARLWLSHSDVDLIKLLSSQWDSVDRNLIGELSKGSNAYYQFEDNMVLALLDRLHLKHYAEHFILLARSPKFVKTLLKKLSLTQLNKLLDADKTIEATMVCFFKENPQEFHAALRRIDALTEKSPLVQLHLLLVKHESVHLLFAQQVKQDYEQNCTYWFDSIIIDHVKNPEDHERVFDILTLCYQRVGGDFYLNFSVPLNESKTRIFLFYQFLGGEALSTLFNEGFDILTEVGGVVCSEVDLSKKYLNQLRRPALAGEYLSFDQLCSDEYRQIKIVSADSQALSRSEWILYLLYGFVRSLSAGYYDFICSDHALFQKIKQYPVLAHLFSLVMGSEDKWFRQSATFSSPLQLAKLVNADEYFSGDFHPFLDWFFKSEPEHRKWLGAISREPEAINVLMTSKGFQVACRKEPGLYNRVSAILAGPPLAKQLGLERARMLAGESASESPKAVGRKSQDPVLVV